MTSLVDALYSQFGKVAILIDEYDHPILANLHASELKELLEKLQSFFSTVKSLGEYVHFLFITGVSAFSKAGIFSGLNHPEDISMAPAFAAICGFTEEEIDTYFTSYLAEVAKKNRFLSEC